MPQAPIDPPLREPVREQLTANPKNGYFAELISRTDPAYQAAAPIRRGTLYSTFQAARQDIINQFSSPLRFVREYTPLGGSDIRSMPGSTYVILYWATDVEAQDSFNSAIEYMGDAVASPVFAREYIIRRETYEASPTIATGTALTALVGIKPTAGGTGYRNTDTVNISGSLGAEAVLVVDGSGVIVNVIVTKGGAGYDSASLPTVTITTTTGSGATLVAIVQPKAAVLTAQTKKELPIDDPMSVEFVAVTRRYETLPGPYIPINRTDGDLGVITGRKRAVLASGQAAAITNAHSLRYEGRDGSSIVSWEIEESWDNTAFPIEKTDFFDPERGAVHQTSQLTTDTTTAGSSTVPVTDTIRAKQFVIFNGTPSNNDTVTVNGRVYTFKTNLTGAANEIHINGQDGSLANLVSAINGAGVAGTDYGTDTSLNVDVTADAVSFHGTYLRAKNYGTQGNSLTLAGSGSNIAVGGATFSGGSGDATATLTRYEPFQENPNLRKKIIETWAVPRTLTDRETTTDFGGGTLSVARTRASTGQIVDEGLLVVGSAVKAIGDGSEQKTTKTAVADWPTLLETEFDSRFGVLVNIAKKVVAAGTTGSTGSLAVTEVKALDKWRSIQIVGSLDDLPSDQVWYGTRNHTFPDELIGFTLAGSTTVEVQFDIRDGYSGPCSARFTRSFTEGPPAGQPEPTIFRPQSYSQFLEYNASRTHTTVSQGTTSSEHSGTSREDSTSTGTTNHNDNSTSTNNGTSQSNHQSTEQGQSTTSQTGLHDSVDQSDGRHHNDTTSNSRSEGREDGERHSTSQVDHSEDHSDDTDYHNSHDNRQDGENHSDATVSSRTDSRSNTSSIATSNTNGSNSGTSQSTTASTSNQTSTGTSQHSSTNSGSNSSSGTSQQTSSSTGSVQTTAPSILQVNVPKTLHDALSLTNSELGITISIPATDPIALPHDDWIIVDSQSEHWRFGVWVTETIEILVP